MDDDVDPEDELEPEERLANGLADRAVNLAGLPSSALGSDTLSRLPEEAIGNVAFGALTP
ncbi:MAG: hypothetical protein WKF78_07575 [Candidatus Limnocylindrales bacterium]